MNKLDSCDAEFDQFCKDEKHYLDIMHNFTLMHTKMNRMQSKIYRLSKVIDNNAWQQERLTDTLIEVLELLEKKG